MVVPNPSMDFDVGEDEAVLETLFMWRWGRRLRENVRAGFDFRSH